MIIPTKHIIQMIVANTVDTVFVADGAVKEPDMTKTQPTIKSRAKAKKTLDIGISVTPECHSYIALFVPIKRVTMACIKSEATIATIGTAIHLNAFLILFYLTHFGIIPIDNSDNDAIRSGALFA